uniref:Uncharacterized protein n=1 Tax=Arundo donax TaxID=35708 RepID=A0A0A9TPR8_ARUDO
MKSPAILFIHFLLLHTYIPSRSET